GLELRNLNFTTTILELNVSAIYYFKNISRNNFTPYLFVGVAGYHFNPYTFDSAGTKVYLKPLCTEGEGFYPGRKNYSLNQLAIPFGIGFRLSVSDRISFGFETGIRKLMTDYLDDVSTTYIDQALLLANRDQVAVDLAYR